jgi:hypothetical protein
MQTTAQLELAHEHTGMPAVMLQVTTDQLPVLLAEA